jgi:hypothetical protein
MRTKDVLAWDVFLKLLESKDVQQSLRITEDKTKCRIGLFKLASDTAYDYILWTQGELK